MINFSIDINNFDSHTKFDIDSLSYHKYHKLPIPPQMGAKHCYWRNNTLKDKKKHTLHGFYLVFKGLDTNEYIRKN
jgi:hypothetical protein